MTGLAERRVREALDALAARSQPAAAGVASALACAAAAALVELTAGLAADRLEAEKSAARAPNGSDLREARPAERGSCARRLLASPTTTRAPTPTCSGHAIPPSAREPSTARAGRRWRSPRPPPRSPRRPPEIARAGTWPFRADAVVAAELAATAALGGADLVVANLAAAQGDPRIDRARAAAERAANARAAAASPASS